MFRTTMILCPLLLALAACASAPGRPAKAQRAPGDTPECMNYRAMMTAPMPPTEVARLEDRCRRSLERLGQE